MSFVLTAGSYASIERDFCRAFQDGLAGRADPLRDQHLVLVPSAALRKHLLQLLFTSGCKSFSAVRVVSLNGLAQEILLDSLQEGSCVLDDPIYFVLALQSVAQSLRLKTFQSYRTAKSLLSTIRDLVDGLLTPDLMEQFLDQARNDPETRKNAGNLNDLRELHRIYQDFLDYLRKHNVVNVQYASAIGLEYTQDWLAQKNIRALYIYGFYDATPAQYELMETLSRQIHATDGPVRMYYPFATVSNSVEHPAEYAQEFFDTVRSLTTKLGGDFRQVDEVSGASRNLENKLFAAGTSAADEPAI